MRAIKSLAAVLAIVVAAKAAPGQTVAAPSATGKISAPLEAALRGLSSDDFQERQNAGAQIRSIMAGDIRQMAETDDPESTARIAALLHFSAGLSEWVAATLEQPAKERRDLLDWGLAESHREIVAGAFSPVAANRAAAARQLAKLSDAPAQALLARLLRDPEREVYLAAMEAVWDQQPSADAVDALLDRAYVAWSEMYRPAANQQGVFVFHGRTLPALNNSASIQGRMQDGDVATQVLAHFKSPVVAERLVVAVEQQIKSKINPFWPPGSENFATLIDGLRSKQMVPLLYKLATVDDGHNQISYFGGAVQGMWSGRIQALGLLCKLTGQATETYKLTRHPSYQRLWLVPAEKDEAASINQLKEWWKQHHTEYEDAPATQPGTTPATAP